MPYKVLPETTEKQKEIMDMMWKFRFMNRHQIQKMFGYKSPRRLNDWLRDLVEKGYLGRIYSRKLLENTKPSIYYLMNNGIILHRYRQFDYDQVEAKDMKKFYDDKKASDNFINHNTAVCNLYQQFKALNNDTWEYQCWTKNELWTMDKVNLTYNEEEYYPDLYIEKTHNEDVDQCFTYCVELYDPHVPRYALEGKVRKYLELYSSSETSCFKKDEDMPLTILLIFPNVQKLNRLKKYIEEKLFEEDIDDLTFKLTTYQKAIERGVGADIWKTVKYE